MDGQRQPLEATAFLVLMNGPGLFPIVRYLTLFYLEMPVIEPKILGMENTCALRPLAW